MPIDEDTFETLKGPTLELWDKIRDEIENPVLATGSDVLRGPIDLYENAQNINKSYGIIMELYENPDLPPTSKLEKMTDLFATWIDYPLTSVYHDFVEAMDNLLKKLVAALDPTPEPEPGTSTSGWPPTVPVPPKDPLILDLDGNGIELISVQNSTAYFDFNKDGFAEKTGWVTSTDGLLFHDQNSDGIANGIDELFGSASVDGFTELSALDSNNDNRIDAMDAQFNGLSVWRDLNHDGISTANEISSLAQLDIVSFGLERTEIRQENAGNEVRYAGTVTFGSGAIHATGAVYFSQNNTLTRWTNPDNIQVPNEVKILPQIAGYGTLVDLQYAMVSDTALRGLVEGLLETATDMTSSQLDAAFEDILFRWANVDEVNATSRGMYVDAREIAFLETFFGIELQDAQQSIINARFAATLNTSFEDVKGALFLRFASQIAVSSSVAGQDLEDITDSPLFAFVGLRYDAVNDKFAGNLDQIIDTLVVRMPEGAGDIVSYFDIALPLLSGGTIEFGQGDSIALKEHLLEEFSAINDPIVLEIIENIYDSKHVVSGTAASESISSVDGKTTFYGGAGDDTLQGGSSEDLYVYARGDGNDVINDNFYGSSGDTLVLANITPSEVVISTTGGNAGHGGFNIKLEFAESGGTGGVDGSILLTGAVEGEGGESIDRIVFQDGTVWTKRDVVEMLIAQQITDGDDTVLTYYTDDMIHGGKGNDYLAGSLGYDMYTYSRGDGHDTIDDYGGSDTNDRLIFSGVNSTDVSLHRSGHDVVVTIREAAPGAGDGGSIVFKNQMLYTTTYSVGVDFIVFADGVTWNRAVLAAAEILPITGGVGDDTLTGTAGDDVFRGGLGDDTLVGGEGSDTYIYASGDGSDYIAEASYQTNKIDTLKFVDLNASDISAARVGSDLRITVLSTGDVITIEEQSYNPTSYRGFEKIEFADGTFWDRSTIMAIPAAPVGPIIGTANDDELTGTSGDDIFEGGLGDDILLGSYGADTYIYSSGDGSDYIDDEANESGSIDILRLTDLNAADISAVRVGVNLNITVLATGDVITIDEQWFSPSAYWGFEKIEFADGTFWDRTAIMALDEPESNPDDEMLTGTGGNDIMEGGLGNDLLVGAEGSDTYIYTSGDGYDLIDDEANEPGEVDSLVFTNLNASNITADREGVNLHLTVNTTGHVIVIDQQWHDPNEYWGLERIQFANGMIWDRATIMAIGGAPTDPNDEVITGTVGNDVLEGGLGDDLLLGAEGSDTYIYASGDGNDYIDDEADEPTEIDALVFTDLNASDITARRKGLDLDITVNATGHVITIDEQWYDSDQYWGFEKIQFADGTFWDRTTIMAIEANPNDEVLTGTDGDDVFEGGLGDDLLLGDEGSDTYIYSLGDGDDYIDDEANEPAEIDALVFTDLNTADITVQRNGMHLDITVNATGHVITIDEQWFDPRQYWGLEKIEFADGTFWDRSTIMAIGSEGSPPTVSRVVGENDDISPFSSSNIAAFDGHSRASPAPNSLEFGSADVIAFPAASIAKQPSYEVYSSHGGEGASVISEAAHSAEILSFAEFAVPLADEDDKPDIWFEPEPIGALV